MASIPRRAGRPLARRLTAREREVMRWVAQGKTDREIAAILTCAPKTVEKHLEHIFDKLEVPNRAAAVAVTLSAPSGADP